MMARCLSRLTAQQGGVTFAQQMRYTVARGESVLGEFSQEEVEAGLQTGRFLTSDLVWQDGMLNWAGAGLIFHARGEGEGKLIWEKSRSSKAFLTTIKNVLTNPADTFKGVGGENWSRAYLFFVICFGLGSIFSIAYQTAAAWILTSAAGGGVGGQAEELGFQGGLGVILNGLFSIPFTFCLGVFIPPAAAGVIHLCLLVIGGGSGGWGSTFKAYCYASGAAMALFLIPLCGGIVGWGWGIVCSVVAVREVHGISTVRAALAIFLPLILCCGSLAGIGLATAGGALMLPQPR